MSADHFDIWTCRKEVVDALNAVQRVRELAKAYDLSGDQDLWRVSQDIIKALDGEQQ